MTANSLSSFANGATTAYNREFYFALRSTPLFEMIADVKAAQQPIPGTAVVFDIGADLAVATTALTETSDVSAVAMTNPSQVTVTPVEYGNAGQLTAKLRAMAFVDIDAINLNTLGYNAADSLDSIALTQLQGGTNVLYANGAAGRTTITPTSTWKSVDTSQIVAKMRGNKAPPRRGNFYIEFVHPDVAHDARNDTASAGWVNSHIYSSPQAIYAGEVGAYGGAVVVETPRISVMANSGSSPTTTDVYLNLVVGAQALAVATAIEAHLVQSPITDSLRRLVTFGWYSLKGYSRFREASIYRYESSSSIGAN